MRQTEGGFELENEFIVKQKGAIAPDVSARAAFARPVSPMY
jgi:hypothetical protein